MTTQWGPPLTGAQMKMLRAAGLPDGTAYDWLHSSGRWILQRLSSDIDMYGKHRLPADHPAYTLLKAGWLDGRNVALWFGGESAPDDWDGGRVLLNDGTFAEERIVKAMPWDCGIIAYIRKAETITLEKNRDLALRNLEKCGLREPARETVTLEKMTEAEAKAWCMTFHHNDRYAAYDALDKLGLVTPTPEPTRAERFTAATGIAATPEILQALEFEQ